MAGDKPRRRKQVTDKQLILIYPFSPVPSDAELEFITQSACETATRGSLHASSPIHRFPTVSTLGVSIWVISSQAVIDDRVARCMRVRHYGKSANKPRRLGPGLESAHFLSFPSP